MEKLSLLDAGDICRAIDANSEEMLNIRTDIEGFMGALQDPGGISHLQIRTAYKQIEDLKAKYNVMNKRVQDYADRLKTLPVYIPDSIINTIADCVADKGKGDLTFDFDGFKITVIYSIHTDGYREQDTNAYIVTDVYGSLKIEVSNGSNEIDSIPNADKVEEMIKKEVENIIKQ